MSLNCRQGDLARIISNERGLEPIKDKLVICDRITEDGVGWYLKDILYLKAIMNFGVRFGNGKEFIFRTGDICSIQALKDSCLRPIRDQPGQDESLLWAPVPKIAKPKEIA